MAVRIGLPTIRKIAFQMCRLVTTYTPIIKATYPSNVALHAALEAANLACAALVSEADSALPIGD